MKRTRVVLDTNVLVSALVFGGPPKMVLHHCIEGAVQLLLSESILEELIHVLEDRKFRYPKEFIRHLTQELLVLAEMVQPKKIIVPALRDAGDLHVLECALAGKAQFIVTGDLDLLDLKAFSHVRIIKPSAFLEFLVGHHAN